MHFYQQGFRDVIKSARRVELFRSADSALSVQPQAIVHQHLAHGCHAQAPHVVFDPPRSRACRGRCDGTVPPGYLAPNTNFSPRFSIRRIRSSAVSHKSIVPPLCHPVPVDWRLLGPVRKERMVRLPSFVKAFQRRLTASSLSGG